MSTLTIDRRVSPAFQCANNGQRAKGVAVPSYLRWKRGVDLILALLMLIPAIPVIGLLVFLVRLTSPGPGIYRQTRVGKGGREFVIFKIRSMARDAESKTGAVWAANNDPRVTRLGAVLRKLHLDELPQLWNVVRGEMSLVGPRPERPEIVPVLEEEIQGYCDRLVVAPGITGLAQVNLPPDTDLDSVRRKLYLDLDYVKEASFALDVRLVLATCAKMLKIPQRIANRILRVHREVPAYICDVKPELNEAALEHELETLLPACEWQPCFAPAMTLCTVAHDL